LDSKRLDGQLPLRQVRGNHVDGVLNVLHRAPRGTLRTRSGTYQVRPGKPDDSGEFLFSIDFLDQVPPDADLEVDALELSFPDATFSLGGEAIQRRGGDLLVCRSPEVRSVGLDAVPPRSGTMSVRLAFEDKDRRVAVSRFSVEHVQIPGAGLEGIEFQGWDELICGQIEFHEDGRAEIVAADFVIEHVDASGDVRLGVIVEGAERMDFVRIYRQVRFPQLTDRGAIEADDVIRLFEDSKYLVLRESCSGPTDAWCCPDFASALSEDAIYRAKDGTLLGHISVTRAYSRAWIGHQLATLKGHEESPSCRVALYGHCISAPVAVDGRDDVFLVSYYDRSKRWHRLFFEAFCDWVADDNLVAIVPFDRFEPIREPESMADAAGEPIPAGASVEVRECEADELDAVESLIRAQLPDIACDAFDIDRDRLAVTHLHEEYARHHVERGRRVLVMLEDGQLKGAALLEHSNRHLSLFNLFNMGQVFFAPHADIAPWARAALVRKVREEYASRGVDDPLITAPPGTFPNPEQAGLRLEETMGCIIWSGEALRHYQAYLRYCFEMIGDESLVRRAH
jgi:hypothetical protein